MAWLYRQKKIEYDNVEQAIIDDKEHVRYLPDILREKLKIKQQYCDEYTNKHKYEYLQRRALVDRNLQDNTGDTKFGYKIEETLAQRKWMFKG